MAAPEIEAVAAALGHSFDRLELLRDALTHRSFVNEHPEHAPLDNERLEFLGDAVLGLVAATLLWEHFPDASEGELTRRRSHLVSEQGLARVARELGLGAALRLGRGEERSGGRDKPRLLASALEACVAAVYLDGGIEAALGLARRLFAARIALAGAGEADFKSRAQELVQRTGMGTPRYEIVRSSGPDHAREFVVAMIVGTEEIAQGEGRSRVEAEQDAARHALERLEAEQAEQARVEAIAPDAPAAPAEEET